MCVCANKEWNIVVVKVVYIRKTPDYIYVDVKASISFH
jgi:hypothetical protein